MCVYFCFSSDAVVMVTGDCDKSRIAPKCYPPPDEIAKLLENFNVSM